MKTFKWFVEATAWIQAVNPWGPVTVLIEDSPDEEPIRAMYHSGQWTFDESFALSAASD